MNFLDSSLVTSVFQRFASGNFSTIAVVTFFLCEGIFSALPIERARMKQLTSVMIGAALGGLLQGMPSLTDSVMQGLLAGGATTIAVAKFKKPSSVVATDISSRSPLIAVQPSESSSIALPTPVEHL